VHVALIERGLELRPEALAEGEDAGVVGLPLFLENRARLAEADDAGDVEGAAPHPALVAAAVQLRDEANARLAPPDVERADPLRAVHLVRGDGGEVDVHLLDVEVD